MRGPFAAASLAMLLALTSGVRGDSIDVTLSPQEQISIPVPAGVPTVSQDFRIDLSLVTIPNPAYEALARQAGAVGAEPDPDGSTLVLTAKALGLVVFVPWPSDVGLSEGRVALSARHPTAELLRGKAGVAVGDHLVAPVLVQAVDTGLLVEIGGVAPLVVAWPESPSDVRGPPVMLGDLLEPGLRAGEAQSRGAFGAVSSGLSEVQLLFCTVLECDEPLGIVVPSEVPREVDADQGVCVNPTCLSDEEAQCLTYKVANRERQLCSPDKLFEILPDRVRVDEDLRPLFARVERLQGPSPDASLWATARSSLHGLDTTSIALPLPQEFQWSFGVPVKAPIGPAEEAGLVRAFGAPDRLPNDVGGSTVSYRVDQVSIRLSLVSPFAPASGQTAAPAFSALLGDGVVGSSERGLARGFTPDSEGVQDAASDGSVAGPMVGAGEPMSEFSAVLSSIPLDSSRGLVAIAAGLAALLPLWLLHRRIVASRALEHSERRRIYDFVVASPASTPADVRDATGLHYTTCIHHLRLVQDTGHIELRRFHGQVHCFENHGRYGAAETRLIAASRSPTGFAFLRIVLRQPGITPGEVAAQLGIARPSAKYHMDRLAADGLLAIAREGARVRMSISSSVVDALVAILADAPMTRPA